MLTGGGTESASNYSQWKIYNRSMDEVDNQQQLLENFSKLIEGMQSFELKNNYIRCSTLIDRTSDYPAPSQILLLETCDTNIKKKCAI